MLAGLGLGSVAQEVERCRRPIDRVVHHDEPEPEATVPVAATTPPALDVSNIDPCTIITADEAALALLGTPTTTQSVGESVSFSGFGAVGCRYYAQLSPRLDQYLSLSIAPDGRRSARHRGRLEPLGVLGRAAAR